MIWLFAAIVLVLAVAVPGFRKVLLWGFAIVVALGFVIFLASLGGQNSKQSLGTSPAANGSGAIFDGATQANGYTVKPDAPTLDSPVPRDAPKFDTGSIETEDRAHLGSGNESAADRLVKGGGVMSR